MCRAHFPMWRQVYCAVHKRLKMSWQSTVQVMSVNKWMTLANMNAWMKIKNWGVSESVIKYKRYILKSWVLGQTWKLSRHRRKRDRKIPNRGTWEGAPLLWYMAQRGGKHKQVKETDTGWLAEFNAMPATLATSRRNTFTTLWKGEKQGKTPPPLTI